MSEPGSSSYRTGNDAPSQSTPPRRGRASARGSPRTQSAGRQSTAAGENAPGATAANTPDTSRMTQVAGTSSMAPSAAKEARENAERMHLNNLLNDLNAQIEKLRNQVEYLREQTQRHQEEKLMQMQVAGAPSSAGLVMDDEIEAVLRGLDDDALASLLTSSSTQLLQQLTGQKEASSAVSILAAPPSATSAVTQAFLAVPPPALSAGIEGRGTGTELETRLNGEGHASTGAVRAADSPNVSPSKRRRTGAATQDETQDEFDMSLKAREASRSAWMESWLQTRKVRGENLVARLRAFTGWEIQSVKQSKSAHPTSKRGSIRSVTIQGKMRRIGEVTLSFSVEDVPENGPPHVIRLQPDLPIPVRHALEKDGHLKRILHRNDVPALFNSLRSLSHAGRRRRALFAGVSSRVTSACAGNAVVENADDLGLTGRSGSPRKRRARRSALPSGEAWDDLDENDDESLAQYYEPEVAEALVLKNAKSAQLDLRYNITFDAFGRGITDIALEPRLPGSFTSASDDVKSTLDAIPAQFKRLIHHPPTADDEQAEQSSDATETFATESIVLTIAACFFGAAP